MNAYFFAIIHRVIGGVSSCYAYRINLLSIFFSLHSKQSVLFLLFYSLFKHIEFEEINYFKIKNKL